MEAHLCNKEVKIECKKVKRPCTEDKSVHGRFVDGNCLKKIGSLTLNCVESYFSYIYSRK